MSVSKIYKKISRKEDDFKRFDSLPAKERKRLTEQGCNPHEPEEIRILKQKFVNAERRIFINQLPESARRRIKELDYYTDNGLAKKCFR